MNYEELNNAVHIRLHEWHDKIIVGVIGALIKSHEEFCGCDYCSKLPEYVEMRKQATKYKRMSRCIDWAEHTNRSECAWMYVRADYAAGRMKVEKDRIKAEALKVIGL